MVDVIIEPSIKAGDIEKMKITNAYSVKNNNIKNEEFKDISISTRPSDTLYTAILDTYTNHLSVYLDLSDIGFGVHQCVILSYTDEYRTDHTITLMLRSIL